VLSSEPLGDWRLRLCDEEALGEAVEK